MGNKCLIVMPSGGLSAYPSGHFKRVYDYIVAPASTLAGYWPARLDDPGEKPTDILKNVIECEVAICDLSATNPEALYIIAVRHALNLPVVLIKDLKSAAPVSSDEWSLVEYDESLRIDTVQQANEALSEAVKKSIEKKEEKNERLTRFGIGLPPPEPATFATPPAMDEPVKEEIVHHLPVSSPLPSYVGDPFSEEQLGKIKAGDELFHLHHGKGKVNTVKKMGKDNVANVQFDSGTKLIVLEATDFLRKIK